MSLPSPSPRRAAETAPPVPPVESRGHSLRVHGDGLVHDGFLVEARYQGVLFGPELEFFTVDRESLAPRDCLDTLAGHPRFGSLIQPELAREQVEITTPPSTSLRELEAMLRDLCADLVALLERENAIPLPVALYDTVELRVAETPRYQLIAAVFGEEFRGNAVTLAADQVNIGASDEAQAFRIYNAVTRFLPEFMRFSAASPFRLGRANGIASNRLAHYDASLARFPRATGFPPLLDSLEDYAGSLQEQEVFQHPSTCYKYARPMPQRGVAVEIRCLDKQPTLGDSLAFLALSKALVNAVQSGDLPEAWMAPSAADAARSFLRAREKGLEDPPSHRRMLDHLAAFLDGSERDYLAPLYASLQQGTPADRMLAAAQRYGLQGMYHRLADAFVSSFS